MAKRDLWPEISITENEDNPIKILKDQAEILSQKTKNLITGEVVTNTENGIIYHTLYIVVPVLDNYRFSLLKIAHTSLQYPLFIYDYSKESDGIKVKREYNIDAAIGGTSYYAGIMSIEKMYETSKIIIPEPDAKANSPEEFIEKLKEILQSNDTIGIINSLIAQSL